MNIQFSPGDKVNFTVCPRWKACQWLKKDVEPATVQKVFKNGDVAIALHDVYAAGKDGRRTIHVKPSTLSPA